ncbi:MAG: ribosome silencing factor [Acidobacteriota bacterium]
MNDAVMANLRLSAAALDAKKGFQLIALDVSQHTSIAEAFLICSVGSARQAQAVADEVERQLAAHDVRPLSVEGYQQGSWVLMDYGDFLLHVFLEERREFFALERLWGDAPEVSAQLRAAS